MQTIVRTLDEDFGFRHDAAMPVVSFYSVDGGIVEIGLADVQLGFVASVRHRVLLAFIQLPTLLVPSDVGLGFAEVNVAGQGRR